MAATGAAKEQIEKLRKTFDSLDTDRDGKLPLKELRVLLTAEDGNKPTDLEKRQTDAILQAADENQDGNLEFREFTLLMTGDKAQPSKYRRLLYRAADLVIPNDHRPVVHTYLDAYSCCPPPVFILLITLVEIGIFIYYSLTSGTTPNWWSGCAGCWESGRPGVPGPLMFVPYYRNEAWRFLSYMLLHAGIEHLAGNMIMQLVLGIPLELVHKMWRVAPLYLLGVVVGAMLQYILDPSVFLVGASGGVYALIIAHIANVVVNWVEMPFRWIRVGVIGAFVGFDVGHALYRRFGLGECDSVSYASHLGGAITGLLLGVVILRNIRVLGWEKILFWVALVSFVVIAIACVVGVFAIAPGSAPVFSCKPEPQ